MRVAAVSGALGADVEGLDLSNLDDAGFKKLRAALDQHLVLRLRGQALDRFQLAALGNRFGVPFLHPLVDNGYDDCKAVLELLREPEDAVMFGGESWHADISWLKPAGYVPFFTRWKSRRLAGIRVLPPLCGRLKHCRQSCRTCCAGWRRTIPIIGMNGAKMRIILRSIPWCESIR